jgi:hypothetical protein
MTKLYKKIDRLIDLVDTAKHSSYGVTYWQRGDGSRYREPNWIHCETGRAADAFENIRAVSPGHRRLTVRGEFVSDGYDDAIIAKGIIFILRTESKIQFGTLSLLRNSDIWKAKYEDED